MGVKNAEYWGPAPKEAVKEGAFQPAPGVHGPHSRPLGWLFREAVRVVLTRSQHDADAAGSQAKAAPRALSAGLAERGALPPRARRGRRRAASWLAPRAASPAKGGWNPKNASRP